MERWLVVELEKGYLGFQYSVFFKDSKGETLQVLAREEDVVVDREPCEGARGYGWLRVSETKEPQTSPGVMSVNISYHHLKNGMSRSVVVAEKLLLVPRAHENTIDPVPQGSL